MLSKINLYLIIPVVLFYLIAVSILSFQSRNPPEGIGLKNGVLRDCPGTPNCVLSELKGKPEYVEPIVFEGDPAAAMGIMKQAIIVLGGKIEKEENTYLWATFRGRFWRLVDDMELRLDEKNKVIQVRSGSRLGKGDRGVNRNRVEKLRALFKVMSRLK
jgi:uncharacterized protein (DUF1499 family)